MRLTNWLSNVWAPLAPRVRRTARAVGVSPRAAWRAAERLEDRSLLATTIGVSVIDPSMLGDVGVTSSTNYSQAISSDGRYVAFESYAPNLVRGDLNGVSDVFLRDTLTGKTTRVSADYDGVQGNAGSFAASIAVDAEGTVFVAFYSYASNLVPNDTNGEADIFLKNMTTGEVSRLSTSSTGEQGNLYSTNPDLAFAPDGTLFCAFASYASNLVLDDTNSTQDIFVKNVTTGAVTCASTSTSNAQSDGHSYDPSIAIASDSTIYVGFHSDATNLIANDDNLRLDVFVKNLSTGGVTCASTNSSGGLGDEGSYAASVVVAPNGTASVAYMSYATNLVSNDTNAAVDVFVKNLTTNATTRVSVDASGNQAEGPSFAPSLAVSSSGALSVAFHSNASNLVSGIYGGVFVKTLATGAVACVSTNQSGAAGNGTSSNAALAISPSGNVFVAFTSYAGNLTSDAFILSFGGVTNVFVKSLSDGAVALASRRFVDTSVMTGGVYETGNQAMTPDGRYVVYCASTSYLPGYGYNIWLRDTLLGTTTLVSANSAGEQADANSYSPSVTVNGSGDVLVSFMSYGTNLVTGDTNGSGDYFVKNMTTGSVVRASLTSAGAEVADAPGGTGYWNSVAVAPDGTVYLAFNSYSTSLVSGDTNGVDDVFVKNLTTGALTRVSTDSSGAESDSDSARPSLAVSSDGTVYVAFQSAGSNLVANDTNGRIDVFIKNLTTNATTLVSTDGSGTLGNSNSSSPSLGINGAGTLFVAFDSQSTNFLADDVNGSYPDILLKNLSTSALTLVSTNSSGEQADIGFSQNAALTFDGNDQPVVAFSSGATNLVSGDSNGSSDIFVKSLATGAIICASVNSDGVQGTQASLQPSVAIGSDGTLYTCFLSESYNLVPGIFQTPNVFHWSSADAPTLEATLSGGNLTLTDIHQTGRADDITITRSGSNLVITDTASMFVSAPAGGSLSNGNKTLTMPLTSVTGSLTLNLGLRDDVVTIDFSGGNPLPSGGVIYDGDLGGHDSLNLVGGTTTAITHTFTTNINGSITLSGALAGTLSYTSLEPITDSLVATDRVFDFAGGAESLSLSDAPGAAMTLDSTRGESVIFANPTGSLTINAGSGDDAIMINSVDADGPFGGSLNINGDDGTDSILFVGDVTLAAGKNLYASVESLNVAAGTDIVTSDSGTQTFIADNANLSATSTLTSAADVIFIPATDGRPVVLGAEGVNKLSLTDQELDRITAGTLTIIGSDFSSLNVAGALTPTSNLVLQTAGSLGIQNSVTMAPNRDFTAIKDDGMFGGLSVDAPVTASGLGKITLQSYYSINLTGTGSVVVEDGEILVEANQHGIPTGGIFGGVNIVSGKIEAVGTGAVTIKGKGSENGGYGVSLRLGGLIASHSGSVVVVGMGGAGASSANQNVGVQVLDAETKITSSGGSILVTGLAGGTASGAQNIGVLIADSGAITNTGTGNGATLTVQGTGGNSAETAGSNWGVSVSGIGSQIATSGGALLIEATGTLASDAVSIASGGTLISSNSGSITVAADSLSISGSPLGTINSGTGSTTLRPRAADTLTNLGASDDRSSTPRRLGLLDAELDQITAATINIGDSSSGPITISDSITRSVATNLNITTAAGKSIAFSGSGALDSNGGYVALVTTGTGSITSGTAATDIVAGAGSITLTAGSGGIGTSGNAVVVSSSNSSALNTGTASNANQFLGATGTVTLGTTGLDAGSGTIELRSGTFSLPNSDRINNASSLSVNGASFSLGANDETVTQLTLSSGSVTSTTGVLTSNKTIQTQNGSISAILGGTNGLTQSTSGLTILTGANVYSGTTTLNGGSLVVSGGSAIPDNGAVVIADTAGVALLVTSGETIGMLSGGGATGGEVQLGSTTLTVGGSGTSTTFAGIISGTDGSLEKVGSGTFTLSGNNSYTGETAVTAGTLLVTGSLAAGRGLSVADGATVGGSGTIGCSISAAAGSNVSPGASPAILNSGNVTFASGANFNVELNGTTVGTQYDQLNVTGTVTLGGATLNATRGFVAPVGTTFTIINNDGTDAVDGTFAGLPEGKLFTIASYSFVISYVGGTGNDVVLTSVNAPPTAVTTTPTSFAIDENTSTTSRIKLADIAITDDPVGMNDLSVSGTDAAFFEIIGTELFLKSGATLNYEAKASYSVAVNVDDTTVGSTPDATQDFTLTLNDVNEAPTAVAVQNATTSLDENTSTSSHIKVADIVVTDDALGTETLSLTGTDAAAFEIVGAELFIKAGTTLNYEGKSFYSVTINVDDTTVGSTPDASTDFTLTLIDVNEAPTGVALQNATTSLAENTSTASHVKLADIVVTDDALGTHALSLTGDDADSFEIGGTELFLKAGTTLNFEGKSSYLVTVNVDDTTVGSTPDATTSFGLTLTDVNEAPTAVAVQNATTSLAENTSTASRVKLGDIVVTDDALGTNALSLSGTDAASFEIVGTELFLKAGTTLNYEGKSSYSVTINADDTTVGSTPDATTSFGLTITDVNEAPTAVALQNTTTSIDENTSATAAIKVADLVVTDDALGTNSLSVSGTDAASFEIVGTSLFIKAGTVLDFEGQASYSVTINVDDTTIGSTPDATNSFSLTLNDVNEKPQVALANVTSKLAENTSAASAIKVADIVATDDALGTNSLSLTGTDAESFEIVGIHLFLKAGVVLNYEEQSSYSVTVEVDDATLGAGPDATIPYSLTVSDVNEPPLVLVPAGITLSEDSSTASRILVGTILVVDDALGVNELSVHGFDSAAFEIDGTNLFLRAGLVLDFETQEVLRTFVWVSDETVGSTPDDLGFVVVTLTDVNEAPSVALQNITATLPENTSTTSAIKVADIVVTDDALGTNELSLSGDDAASFEIVGTELFLKSGTVLNYEAQASYSVTVAVDDATLGGNPDDSAAYSLSLSDVNEAPTGVTLQNATTSLPENTNTTSRVKVADIVVTDDALGTNSLSVTGTDAASFEIVGTSLFIKAGTTLNYEGQNSYSVTIQVDDATVGSTPDVTTSFNLTLSDVNEAASVALQNVTSTLPENTSTTTALKVADIVVTDDALGTNALSLSGTDAASFEIVGTELFLKAGTTLNYEGKSSYSVTINVDDTTIGSTPDASTPFELTITDVNEAPTAVNLQNSTTALDENTSTTSHLKVADIVVTDDALGTNALSLSGTDADSFEIVDTELFLKAGTVLDFEAQASYSVTINVDDTAVGSTPDATTNFTLTINDLDEIPPTANIVDVTPDPRTTNAGVVTIEFSESVAGVDISSFSLTNNGKPIDLSGLTVNGIGASYTINLASVTGEVGNYVLTLNSGSGIADLFGNHLVEEASDSWTRIAPTVSLSVDKTTLAESESAIVTVTLSEATDVEVTVNLTRSGTADGKSDYTLSLNPIVIAAGKTTATATLTATQDVEFEVSESTVLTLGTISNATAGKLDSVAVDITDDDCPIAAQVVEGQLQVDVVREVPTDAVVLFNAGSNEFVVNVLSGGASFKSFSFAATTVTSGLRANLGVQADRFDVSGTSLATTIIGGAGNDSIYGSQGADAVVAGDGDDVVMLYGGDDIANGGDGNDLLRGAGGKDLLVGGVGNDSLYGQGAVDTLDGGAGIDLLDGGAAGTAIVDEVAGSLALRNNGYITVRGDRAIADVVSSATLIGSAGNDAFDLTAFNAGFAAIFAGDGNDTLLGGTVNDYLSGDAGNDLIDGAGGNDNLNGGDGNDTITGNAGNDAISGGLGHDSLSGGDGNDAVLGGGGNDSLAGDAGDDILRGNSGNDLLLGGLGNDSLFGTDGDDTLQGGAGNDRLDGEVGNDLAFEQADTNFTVIASQFSSAVTGTDTFVRVESLTLQGGASANKLDARLSGLAVNLIGDAGDDTLLGGNFNDTLRGGAGNDVLSGGAGNDVLSGGMNSDTIYETLDVNATIVGTTLAATTLGTDAIDSVEGFVLIGGPSANRLDATTSLVPVTLLGGGGNDTLLGSSKADVLVGGNRANPAAGTDSLNGGASIDKLDNDPADTHVSAALDEVVANIFAALPSWIDAL